MLLVLYMWASMTFLPLKVSKKNGARSSRHFGFMNVLGETGNEWAALVSSLIVAGSEKTVEFFGAINFKFVSNVQRMFPWISILSSLKDASKHQNLDIYS